MQLLRSLGSHWLQWQCPYRCLSKKKQGTLTQKIRAFKPQKNRKNKGNIGTENRNTGSYSQPKHTKKLEFAITKCGVWGRVPNNIQTSWLFEII